MNWGDIFLTLGFTFGFIALSKFAGWLMPGNNWWTAELQADRERESEGGLSLDLSQDMSSGSDKE